MQNQLSVLRFPFIFRIFVALSENKKKEKIANS